MGGGAPSVLQRNRKKAHAPDKTVNYRGCPLSVTEKQKKAHAPHYYSFFNFQFSVFSKTKSLPLGGKVSTNGRRMRGQPLLLMQVSVRLYVYRGSRKSRKLFVKMISRTSHPLIRFCSQVCSQNHLPPEGKAFWLQRHITVTRKKAHAPPEGKAFLICNSHHSL